MDQAFLVFFKGFNRAIIASFWRKTKLFDLTLLIAYVKVK